MGEVLCEPGLFMDSMGDLQNCKVLEWPRTEITVTFHSYSRSIPLPAINTPG